MKRHSVVAAIVLGVLIYFSVGGRANATPTSPPAGYPYTTRQPMVASNTITFSDTTLQQLGYYHGLISSDAAGTAVTIYSRFFDSPSYPNVDLNYYFEYPYQTPSGAPDLTLVDFDLKDSQGEFAGFQESYTWPSGDQTYYYLYQEVNGEAHYLTFSADANGNVDGSTVMQVRHAKKRPDRCKILADWGALGCPRDLQGIQEIPTQVRSFLTQVGWFDDAMDWTWDKLSRAGNATATFLKDPTVQYVIEGVVIAGTIVAGCYGTAGVTCAATLVAAFGGLAVATGSYANSMSSGVPTITNSPGLRAAGILSCSGSGCQSNCAMISWSGPPAIGCQYDIPAGGSCAAPYSLLPPPAPPNPWHCWYVQVIQ